MTSNEFEAIKAVLIEKLNKMRPALGIAVTTPIVASVSPDARQKIGLHVYVTFNQVKTLHQLLAGYVTVGDIQLWCNGCVDCGETTFVQFAWERISVPVQPSSPIVVDNSMFTMENPYNMNLSNN